MSAQKFTPIGNNLLGVYIENTEKKSDLYIPDEFLAEQRAKGESGKVFLLDAGETGYDIHVGKQVIVDPAYTSQGAVPVLSSVAGLEENGHPIVTFGKHVVLGFLDNE